MRHVVVAVLLAAAPFAAHAQSPASEAARPRTGQILRDTANLRIGAVDSVRPDGSVGVIVGSRYVVVPASTLSLSEGKLTTSLTKKAVVHTP